MLPPDIMKARLSVVLAMSTTGCVQSALSAWLVAEPQAAGREPEALIEAVTLAIGADRALALVLFASSSFRAELAAEQRRLQGKNASIEETRAQQAQALSSAISSIRSDLKRGLRR